jgi:hypothetical protein
MNKKAAIKKPGMKLPDPDGIRRTKGAMKKTGGFHGKSWGRWQAKSSQR